MGAIIRELGLSGNVFMGEVYSLHIALISAVNCQMVICMYL